MKLNIGQLLLDQLLDLTSYSPVIEDWNEGLFKDNPPRSIRLKRINSYLKALNIDCNYATLFNGEFVKDTQCYSINKLIELYPEARNSDFTYGADQQDWEAFYKQLMKHVLLVDEVLNFNSGLLSASGLYGSLYIISSKTNNQIRKAIGKEKIILTWLLNPEKVEMSIDELINKYDYPDVDLSEIDLEWI